MDSFKQERKQKLLKEILLHTTIAATIVGGAILIMN
jgi:hypothetical protein